MCRLHVALFTVKVLYTILANCYLSVYEYSQERTETFNKFLTVTLIDHLLITCNLCLII